jgi:hypothetical protein
MSSATATATVETESLPPPKRTFKRDLGYRLSFEEIHDYGKKLARKKVERDALDEKKKNLTKQLNGQLAEIDAEVDRLSDAVDTGEELRSVECGEFFEGSQKVVRRLDTYEEIDRGPLSWADQQTEIPGLDADSDDFPSENHQQDGDVGEVPPLEMVTSSMGDEVAHMPDDPEPVVELDAEGEAPAEAPVPPAGDPPKAKRGRKAKKG